MIAALLTLAATIDGIPVHYTNHGSGAEAIVLVHGWTCDESFWKDQVPALRGAGYRVITVDLPGHGRSGAAAERWMSMRNFARALVAVMDEAGVRQAIVAGHSMGAPVAREFARMDPARAKALVIVDGSIFRPADASFRQGRGLIYQGEEGRQKRLLAIRSYFGPQTSPTVRAQIEKVMMAAPEATAVGAINALYANETWADESPVRRPTLAIYHQKAQLPESYLRQLFPALTYRKIPGTGHFLMMERPAEFNRVLTAWLATLR